MNDTSKCSMKGFSLHTLEMNMTVAEYFGRNRDEHGRARLTQHCWIEQAVGCFRLNTPKGEVLILASDDMKEVETIASQVPEAPKEDPNLSDRESDGTGGIGNVSISDDEFADHFDDFRGVGAWPGRSADDAESGDFEVDELSSDDEQDEYDNGSDD